MLFATLNLCNLGADAAPWRLEHFGRLIASPLGAPALLALQEVKAEGPPAADGTVPATATWQALIDAIAAAGGPRYAYREIAPLAGADGGQAGFNIRVGALHDPARLAAVERQPGGALDATGVRRGPDGCAQLTRSPGRIAPLDPAFAGCGEHHWRPSRKALALEYACADGRPLVLVNCHLKSMRAENRRAEDYAKKQRHAQAAVIHAFCASLLALDARARLIVAGDFNDAPGSKTLDLLKGTRLVNLLEDLPRHLRHTHRHGRQPQTLDHVLVSPALRAARAQVLHVHSNAAAPAASDHDPVLAELPVPCLPAP